MLLQANLSAALPVNDYFFHKAHFSVFFLFSVIRNPGYLGHNFHTGATQVYQAGNDDRKAAASFTIYYCNLKKDSYQQVISHWVKCLVFCKCNLRQFILNNCDCLVQLKLRCPCLSLCRHLQVHIGNCCKTTKGTIGNITNDEIRVQNEKTAQTDQQ